MAILNIRRWTSGVIVIAVVIVGLIYYVVDNSATRARFLMATPDNIVTDTELMRYALPRGKSAYAKHCATCHGDRLQGDAAQGNPRLDDDDWLYGSGRVGEIERTILYGIRSGNSKGRDLASMPAYATARPYKQYKLPPLLPHEIDDVAAFLQSFQHAPGDAAAVQRGAAIYYNSDKGVCWDCHGGDAKGDTAIGAPNLTDTIWLYGDGLRESIYNSVAHGVAGVCPAWISRLPPETIRAIAAFVYSVRNNAAASAKLASTGKAHE